MTFGSLFSGIGGLDLGLERAGMECKWQVEIDDYATQVLERHWPSVPRFRDVRDCGGSNLEPVELIAGGFPCQPVSLAGKRKGKDDARWLWPEFRRIVKELEPAHVIVENVLGLRSSGLRGVLADLAALGFDAEWDCFSAAEYGAPHIRRRIFIVAIHPGRVKLRVEPRWIGRAHGQGATLDRDVAQSIIASDPDGLRRLESAIRFAEVRGWAKHCGWSFDPTTRVDDGLPRGVVGPARRALGNAVVPRAAEAIGRVAMATNGRR